MTAKEWEEWFGKVGCFDGLGRDAIERLIADLASAEVERDRLREELADYKAYYEALHRTVVDTEGVCIAADRIEARRGK